jgi:hypothetical protein
MDTKDNQITFLLTKVSELEKENEQLKLCLTNKPPKKTKREMVTRDYSGDQELFTVAQFSAKHKAFTIGGMRHIIFKELENGLKKSGAIVRIGSKVLINEEHFFQWVNTQNS